MRIAVKDALSRYTPAVPEEYYKVSSDCILEETEFEHLHKCCKLLLSHGCLKLIFNTMPCRWTQISC